MTDLARILDLEEFTLNTSPALHEAHIAGWVARASQSQTRRSNSATALYANAARIDDTIDRIEAWYRVQQQAPMFRLSPLTPVGFDEALAARGYVQAVTTSVMLCDLRAGIESLNLPPGMKCVARGIEDGTLDLHRLKGSPEAVARADAVRQTQWRGTQTFLTLRSVNGLVATGLARYAEGRIGLFNIHTAPGLRRKGFGAAMTRALLQWGVEQGATEAFLQVDEANVAAVSLYGKLGFVTAYSYWHRIVLAP